MRSISLDYVRSLNNCNLILNFGDINITAAAESIDVDSGLQKLNNMKAMIKSLVSQILFQIKDITDEEQALLDGLVVNWIKENAPDKNITILRGKTQ
jgi:hypothetical protein